MAIMRELRMGEGKDREEVGGERNDKEEEG